MWRYIHSHLQGRDPFGQQRWRKGPRLCGREVYSVRKYVFLHFTYFCHTDLQRPPYRPMPWRKCKTLLDSGFHAVDSGFLASGILACSAQAFSLPCPTIWTPRTGLYNFGFRNLKVCGISDSLSRVPDSKAQISNSRICITLNEATHNSLSLYLPVPFFVSVFLPHR